MPFAVMEIQSPDTAGLVVRVGTHRSRRFWKQTLLANYILLSKVGYESSTYCGSMIVWKFGHSPLWNADVTITHLVTVNIII